MADTHNEFEPGDHFHIGDAEAEYVEVWVVSRSEADDYWDGNWLTCRVRVAAGGFQGRFEASLRTDEISTFYDQVQSLYQDLKGMARFEPMEEQLQLVLEGDGRGHIRCSGQARDVAGTGNLLKFELYLDQTQLFGTMVQLAELLNRFPVRGSPAA